MRRLMFVASDEATSGSVIENAERISPSSSGERKSCLTCSLPYRLRISMLPVSGAAQFSASDAKLSLPSSSEIGAYSRLVIFVPGAPGSRCGMNRFHSPRSRAAAFIFSMTGG